MVGWLWRKDPTGTETTGKRAQTIRTPEEAAQHEWGRLKTFPALGVKVACGKVARLTLRGRGPLGSVADAEAMLTDGTDAPRFGAAMAAGAATGGPGLLVGLSNKSECTTFVTFTDGTYNMRRISGSRSVRAAQEQVFRFNLLARAERDHPFDTMWRERGLIGPQAVPGDWRAPSQPLDLTPTAVSAKESDDNVWPE
jgi:hypothetical protein